MTCPEGTHREHARQPDGLSRQSSYDDRGTDATALRDQVSDYRCVPDASCDELDCGDHGRCIEGEGLALCDCDDGYVGEACTGCAPGYEAQRGGCALTASCDRDQCSGRGTCVQGRDGLQCECQAGVAGPRCTHCADGFHAEGARCVRDESCRADSCSGHGTCTARDGALSCACDRGYAGPRCELTCIGNDCNGRGSCAALDGVPTCRCTEGYDSLTDCATCETGYTSDTTSEPGTLLCVRSASCPSDGCSGHGTCAVDAAAGRVCTCDAGYWGSTCAECASGYVRVGARCVPSETCAASACSGHGSCDLRGRVGGCVCGRGYGGDDCSELNEPTQVLIRGAEQTLLTADPIVLTAAVYGVGDFDDTLTWQIVDGPGSIVSSGATATFMPPSDLAAPETTTVAVFSPSGRTWQTTLQTFPPDEGAIPIRRGNGANDFRFGPLDNAITDFMRARCAGAMVVAVSRYGAEVYRAGYGRRYGAPVEDELWLERCPHDDFKQGDWVTEPTTPFYIGSNNKAITAAMAWEAARRRYVDVHGVDPTQAQLYAMKICNAAYDLLPTRLHDVLCGEEPLVVPPYNGADPPLPPYTTYSAAADACAEAPCNNGGVCSPLFAGYSGVVPLYVPFCVCPQGFSGGTCMLCPEIQASPPRFDARFKNVLLGDVVSHRSGLPRGGADDATLFEALATLRELSSAGDFAAEEAVVDPSGTAKANLQDVRDVTFDDDREAFFVPQPTDLESALVNAGTCLERAPGSESYSNYGYQLLQILVSHVFDKRYTAPQGEPGAHVGSALQEFLHDELGLLSGEATPFGIYGGQQVPGLVEPVETSYRYYSGTSYYPLAYDVKRPDCVWDGSSCSFDEWLSGPRFNFLMSPPNTDPAARVPIDFSGSGTGPGIGGLVVEHPIWLRFMRKFWIAGSGQPTYGQRRFNVWTTDRAHLGKRPTAMFSYQQQLGTGTLNYAIPPLEAGGHIALDADQDELVSMSCTKPNGVDVIVTVNQTRDELCADEEQQDNPGYTCAEAYERLIGYVAHGLCGVQWSLVQTDPFGVVQPEPPDPCALQSGLSPGCVAIGN
jgi:CubicO group peptidase (beta-lactamase class C family)